MKIKTFQPKEFQKALNNYFDKKKLSLREVEAKTGISYLQIYRISEGEQLPNVQSYFTLCKLMNVSVNKFFK